MGKSFSTFACVCKERDGTPSPLCNGCFSWQRADLVWEIDGWVKANPTQWFGLSNIWVDTPDGWQRDSGYARLEDGDAVVDFLMLAGQDFTLEYEPPSGDEWRFQQRHLSEPFMPSSCKVFYTSDRNS